jgi:hypothetical protein
MCGDMGEFKVEIIGIGKLGGLENCGGCCGDEKNETN